jgi:glycosyltransferase involved in cell wall biosynthesis
MRIRYVLFNAYAVGGTIRSVVNQANALCAEHDVEIASVFRHRARPTFAIDPRVNLVSLTDLRSNGRPWNEPGRTRLLNRARRFRNRLPHGTDWRFKRWDPVVDLHLLRYLWSAEDGVLVTTRPGLNLFSAWFAPRRLIRIGQDHRNLGVYPAPLRAALRRAYPRLDAVTTLTAGDEAAYRAAFAGVDLRLESIPNGVPPRRRPPADLTAKVFVAAGRLERAKGFDLLLDAFALVSPRHPDWQLRIFGDGKGRAGLLARIDRLGLTGRAHLMGTTDDLDAELAAASAFVLSSRSEGLPMVLLEAMAAGLPVVSYDCPTGPADIVRPGRTGLLIPPGDVSGLAAGLTQVIERPARRREMGQAALREAERYSIASVGEQWTALFADLAAARAGRPGAVPTRG